MNNFGIDKTNVDLNSVREKMIIEIKEDEREYCLDKTYTDDELWIQMNGSQSREDAYKKVCDWAENATIEEIEKMYGDKYDYVYDLIRQESNKPIVKSEIKPTISSDPLEVRTKMENMKSGILTDSLESKVPSSDELITTPLHLITEDLLGINNLIVDLMDFRNESKKDRDFRTQLEKIMDDTISDITKREYELSPIPYINYLSAVITVVSKHLNTIEGANTVYSYLNNLMLSYSLSNTVLTSYKPEATLNVQLSKRSIGVIKNCIYITLSFVNDQCRLKDELLYRDVKAYLEYMNKTLLSGLNPILPDIFKGETAYELVNMFYVYIREKLHVLMQTNQSGYNINVYKFLGELRTHLTLNYNRKPPFHSQYLETSEDAIEAFYLDN